MNLKQLNTMSPDSEIADSDAQKILDINRATFLIRKATGSLPKGALSVGDIREILSKQKVVRIYKSTSKLKLHNQLHRTNK